MDIGYDRREKKAQVQSLPSISGQAASSRQLEADTEPPYRILQGQR